MYQLIYLCSLFITVPCGCVNAIWYPLHNASANAIVFRPFNDYTFEQKLADPINHAFGGITGQTFQWMSVTAFRESSDTKDGSIVWVILGGSVPNQQTHSTSFTKDAVAVVGCKFSVQQHSPVGLHLKECQSIDRSRVKSENKVGLLGLSLVSLELSSIKNSAVLVYCDPLWRDDLKHPGGGCRVRLRQAGEWVILPNGEPEDLLRFCSSVNHSTPCGGGFSVDLLETHSNGNNGLPDVKLLVGLPYVQPYGEAQVVDDTLWRFRQTSATEKSSVYPLRSQTVSFGTQVVWTPRADARLPEVDEYINDTKGAFLVAEKELPESWIKERLALVSSPSAQPWPTITAYRHTGFRASEVAFRTRPSVEDTADFSGFGQALETVRVPLSGNERRAEYAVVVGAPFTRHTVKGVNTGRVYIMCPEPEPFGQHVVEHYLDGPEGHGLFGYSLSRLGDVDGDGIEDIAIGAPGVQGWSTHQLVNGKVYIHRVTPQCTLDPIPVQVLEAPDKQPGDGFGIALARGVDMDRDGWPELIVTALGQENKNTTSVPYIFTMPKRVKAHCQITIAAKDRNKQLRKGTEINVQFIVSINDLYTNQMLPIPEGLMSSKVRVHQINPDVLWQKRESNISYGGTQGENFFLSPFPMNLDLDRPRFELVAEPKPVRNGPSRMQFVARLRARYEAQSINLNIVPLRVAYRSVVRSEECASFSSEERLCYKVEQPLVDWSECQSNLVLNAPVCPGSPSGCSSDLKLSHRDDLAVHDATSRTVQLDFSERHTILRLTLENLGPTKATGVRIQLQTFGKLSSKIPAGVELQLTELNISQSGVNASQSPRSLKADWITHLSEDKNSILLSSKRSIHPNEPIWIDVGIFVANLGDRTVPMQELIEKIKASGQFMRPSIQMRVFSETEDPDQTNNGVVVNYQVVYRPKISIGLGLQPVTLIDHRKEPTIHSSIRGPRKVFSEDIGPKVEHTFLIENPGNTDLTNVSFRLDLPVSIKGGKRLLYLVPRVKRIFRGVNTHFEWENLIPQFTSADGQPIGHCVVPPDYLDPLGLTLVDVDNSGHRKSSGQSTPTEPEVFRSKRAGRNVGYVFTRLEDFDSPALSQTESTARPGIQFRRNEKFRVEFSCDSRTTNMQTQCLSIPCTLTRLGKRDAVRLRWTGWLWAETFFDLQTLDVQFVSRLSVEGWGDLPPSLLVYKALEHPGSETTDIIKLEYPTSASYFDITQSVIFRGVQPKLTHRMPLWLFIVATVIGVFLLTALGLCCYCCGFFRRSTTEELKRKSQMRFQSRYRKSNPRVSLIPKEDTYESVPGTGPLLLKTKPPKTVISLDAHPTKSVTGGNRRERICSKNQNLESEYLIQTSPNLYCAEEPEPPSPRIHPPEQSDGHHSISSANWSKEVEISDRVTDDGGLMSEEISSKTNGEHSEKFEHTENCSLNTDDQTQSPTKTSETSDIASTDFLLDLGKSETASTHSRTKHS